mmetsp:Transcript_54073/g.127749  ORF Transcript_54073/g.127749 Transcript_54073/m.127749 type:complete len:140 (+) Transcript_54073:359-778(+)
MKMAGFAVKTSIFVDCARCRPDVHQVQLGHRVRVHAADPSCGQLLYGGHALATRALLDSGADVNLQCIGDPAVEKGWTALHFAVYHAGSVPVVRELLRAEADVTLRTANYQTALGFAEQCEHSAIADLLLERLSASHES